MITPYVYSICMYMYVVYMWYFAKFITLSSYMDVFPIGLGHNDPWVESHMWPQQMWGQRSSRG